MVGRSGRRYTPHEGLDLHRYEDIGGLTKTVDQHTKIPGAFAGYIVKIDRDFLGRSIYMSHAIFRAGGRQLLSAFGHTVPRESLQTGGSGPPVRSSRPSREAPATKPCWRRICTFTFAWVPVPLALDRLDWKTLS